jgi:DNA-directed RNA polymerase
MSPDECVDPDTRAIKVPKKQFVKTYKETVFTLLDKHRNSNYPLESLQREIEELTLNYSEDSIYKACPNLMEMLTKNNLPSAKEFLRGKYLMDKVHPGRMTVYSQRDCMPESGASKLSAEEIKKLRSVLSESDELLLIEFGEHSLECLLVHTLGHLFNIDTSVSVASLIDRIENNVRHYASFLCSKRGGKNPTDAVDDADVGSKVKRQVKTKSYPFGTALVEFLVSRGLLRLVTYSSDIIESSGGAKTVVKKKNQFYRSSFVYAECMFNPALLPIKLSLPMVFPPKDWEPRLPEHGRLWLNLSDIYGGYLSNPTGQIYSTQRCMSSPDAKSFFIYFGLNNDINSHRKVKMLCTSISSLQRQAFRINSPILNCIISHRALFEESGFLMPEFLSKVILPRASGILRSHYEKNSKIKMYYKFSDVYALLIKNMQRARYECTILDLAKAYEGYSIYFPAFLDFRGRIYRSGIFHFHERDLARSLLLIDEDENKYPQNLSSNIEFDLRKIYTSATGFLYQNYNNEADARKDVINNILIMDSCIKEMDEEEAKLKLIKSILSYSREAKRPFQFLSNVYLLFTVSNLFHIVPVTQDASASAYQLMAYFLLDNTFAKLTNLFDSGDEILDIYLYIREELIKFLKESLCDENPDLCDILDQIITRSIVKQIYMPIIYGKTAISTTKDLIVSLNQHVLPKECVKLATLCFQFWRKKYSYMDAFIDLISLVGRVCSSLERPVLYSAEYFSTSQDYKKMEKHSVRVFDSILKKPHNVTLSFPSNVRDKRKSRTSTFVNFIHQKDAQIAMSMAFLANENGIPLYTVHDNFISNSYNRLYMPELYLSVFKNMGPPLKIINRFLYINLIEPAIENGYHNERGFYLEYFDDKIIPEHILDEFLKIGGTPPSEVKNVAGWKKIIEQLKQRYQLYCNVVCGPRKTFAEHSDRWNKFRNALEGPYCIHH